MSVNNDLYNEIDDVFRVLENGFELRRQEQLKQENEITVKREGEARIVSPLIERAVNRSIKEEEWRMQTKKVNDKLAEEHRKKIKVTILSVLIGASLVSPFALKAGSAIVNKYSHWMDVCNAVAVQTDEVREELLKYRLAFLDERKFEHLEYATSESPFTIKNNSASDYKVLNVKDYIDVYLYKRVLPTDEFNDFIKSLTYTDENGNLCQYTSFEQYLNINGFPNEVTFENYAEEGAYNREVLKNNSVQNVGKGGRN